MNKSRILPNPSKKPMAVCIEGYNCALRLIQPSDAEYVFSLRVNPLYSRYLSKVTGNVGDQLVWIKRYKKRESDLMELYYIIEKLDGSACGTVRLYDIESDQFTWGSWILDENKPPKAALESAILSFGVGFDYLGLEKALVDVRIDNIHAEAFYRRFGMTETHRSDIDIFFSLTRSQFEIQKEHYQRLMSVEVEK